jgi:transmembrane sensor
VGLRSKLAPGPASPVDQAAAWFARHRSGSWSEGDASEFAAWLKADSANTAAWTSYERLWGTVGSVRHDPSILEMRERARRRAAWTQRTRRIVRASAAGVAAAFLVAAAWWTTRQPAKAGPGIDIAQTATKDTAAPVRDASTEVGERSLLVLADGSKVTLNTASAVHIDLSGHERRITLLRGEAYFDVAKDAARPFIVTAGPRQVIAVGTAFDVRLQDRQVSVMLVNGRVRVERTLASAAQSPHTLPVLLDVGSQLVARDDVTDQVQRLNTEVATSWRTGRLVFDDERLAAVITEMNRYSHEKLELTDRSLSERRISGVFEPAGGLGFAKALETYGIARVTNITATTIELGAPADSHP